MISISKYQYSHCGHEVTVIHRGSAPGDVIEIIANTQSEAINKLLEARGLKNIAELNPAFIETKWC
jgi:hypothetical protein